LQRLIEGLITSVDRKIDVKPTLALDAGCGVYSPFIQLKFSRTTLFNVAHVPPEILGHIFRFNINTEAGDSGF